MRVEHDRRATRGSPGCVVLLTVLVISWVAVNSVASKPIDDPPFFWIQGAVSLAALYMTVLILTTQRRENKLASHHEQLTLELAILSEQAAKITSLLEELRRTIPKSEIVLITRLTQCPRLRTCGQFSKQLQ
jgi:uncharacterized membrane protein